MTGTLPLAWADPGALPQLMVLALDHNRLTGTLPPTWANGFRRLDTLWLGQNRFHGSLPAAWAEDDAWPDLQDLLLDNTHLSGEVPPQWTTSQAFPSLLVANFSQSNLSGPLPAYDNARLNVLDVEGCNFNSTLDDLWTSSAPLTAIEASHNNLSGSLPDTPGCLRQLTYLGLHDNHLQGTVPITSLQAGEILSHVSHLDLGTVWDWSVRQADWRQELCLQQPVLFYADVPGQQASLLPSLKQHLVHQKVASVYASRNLTNFALWLSTGGSRTDMALADRFLQGKSQLMSVKQICKNFDSKAVLLILWGVFGSCCLMVVCTYAAACKLATRAGPTYFGLKSLLSPLWALGIVVTKACSGFGGLAFYWYDCISGVIVMCQVWHTWPGHLLALIFFFHFAAVGAILACHAVHRLVGPEHINNNKLILYIVCDMLAVLLSPAMIPVVILLDTVALIREILLFIKHVVRLPGLRWLQPGHVAVSKLHRWVHDANCLGLSWVDLGRYEDMHNLIAAAFQSLPTVILNSVIYALGNRPSNGIYLSDGLFVTSVVASCLAILKCLIIVFWQAYKEETTAAGHIGSVLVGKTLAAGNPSTARALHPQNSNIELLAHKFEVSESAPLEVQQPAPQVQV